MHRVSFPAVRDRLVGLLPGSYVSADVLIMQNIPSREGYYYVLFLIDHAPKKSFVFPLTRRDSGSILAYIKVWVNETLPSYGITLRHFHSDGGAELVSTVVLTFLHSSWGHLQTDYCGAPIALHEGLASSHEAQ